MSINLVNSETLGKVIAEDLLELETGMVMFDAMTKKEIFVQCPVLCITCDNPKPSEICHHLSSSALHFCRECDATSENASEIGDMRTDEAVKTTVQQIQNARSENAKRKRRRNSGVSEGFMMKLKANTY